MEPGTAGTAWRAGGVAAALIAAGLAFVGVGQALGAVSWSDVTAAEAQVSQASRSLAEAETRVRALAQERDDLISSIARLEAQEAEIVELALEEGASIRDRIARMYMTAGAAMTSLASVETEAYATRTAYLGAISDRDRELVIRFALTITDLESLRATAEERLTENAVSTRAAEETAGERAAELEAAQARLTAVLAEWERFEAAQRAAEEAELARQELEAASGGGSTTPPSNPSTTTTTTIAWNPSGGVAQWRPMVAEVFGRWGLDETTCETRNGIQFCVGPQVENALKVIQCESSGNPTAVNSRSGAAGLFQNHPGYWQGRVDRIRIQHASKEPSLPADASIFNPEHNISVAALLVWESKQTLLGRRGGGGVGGAPWPEFNFDVYANGSPLSYGYSVWGRGPNPWAHWGGCAATRGVNALGDSGPPYTYPYGNNLVDSGWIHPWARQQSPP